MAKNMFYNYNSYTDDCKKSSCDIDHQLIFDNYNKQNVDYLYNVKGDFLGIKAKINSDFNLYFNFSSKEELELFKLIHNCPILLDILDFTYEPLVTIPASVNEFINECVINIDLAIYKQLKQGVYKLYLYYIENGTKKPLYTNFNTLSIE